MSAAEQRILLVEDNPADVALIRLMLEESPPARVSVGDVDRLSSAVDRIASDEPGLVLLDLGLPDSMGLETFRRLHAAYPQVPILVLTGLNDEEVGLAAVREGAQDYLIKGELQPALLARSIRYAIERQRLTTSLATSEERFELAITGASAGLWDWDPRMDRVFFATRFKEIVGYTDEEMPNDLGFFRSRIHPDDRSRTDRVLELFFNGPGELNIEYRVRTKSGVYRWINSRGKALRDEAGVVNRIVGWIMDVTERKQAETRLQESQERLRRLATRLQAAQEAERARIAREIHDDLGQTLTGLKMDLRWLTRKIDGDGLSGPVRTKIGEMEALADHTIEVVQRIAIELRPSVLDSLGLAEAIRDEARRFAARSGVGMTVNVAADFENPPALVATACFRILQELLTNVARHAEAGAVVIDLAMEDGVARLVVRDDGKGFPPEVLSARSSLGMLGMAERAADLGGKIQFDSGPGIGTMATLHIPLTGSFP